MVNQSDGFDRAGKGDLPENYRNQSDLNFSEEKYRFNSKKYVFTLLIAFTITMMFIAILYINKILRYFPLDIPPVTAALATGIIALPFYLISHIIKLVKSPSDKENYSSSVIVALASKVAKEVAGILKPKD